MIRLNTCGNNTLIHYAYALVLPTRWTILFLIDWFLIIRRVTKEVHNFITRAVQWISISYIYDIVIRKNDITNRSWKSRSKLRVWPCSRCARTMRCRLLLYSNGSSTDVRDWKESKHLSRVRRHQQVSAKWNFFWLLYFGRSNLFSDE